MPRGTAHTLTGLLVWDGFDLALDVDGGGRWHIDPWPAGERLVDRRVVIAGIRSGFDRIDPTSIMPA